MSKISNQVYEIESIDYEPTFENCKTCIKSAINKIAGKVFKDFRDEWKT